MLCESRLSDEKAKKAMIDAARLAEELRSEQDHAQLLERDRRVLDIQVKDMHTKLDEAEQLALKGGRKVVQRLEQRVRELEMQLDDEQRRYNTTELSAS
jgi:myosin heavy chain 6/7